MEPRPRRHFNSSVTLRVTISAPSSPFKYEQLDSSRRQFRVLRIIPRPDIISCEIKVIELKRPLPIYKALSYTWGEPFPARQILVNGKQFTVRENLYQFLDTIRGDGETWFFIDQICINQSAVRERNHQVNFMDKIYKNASEVVLWLGLGSRKIDRLCCRPVWKRAWVLQEIMLARSVVVYYNRDSMKWSDFEEYFRIPKVIRTRPGEDIEIPEMPSGAEEARAVVSERAEFESGQRLSYILTTFSNWVCEKPRDKVYALLGLVPEHLRVPVDYEKSPLEIFTDVITKVVYDESFLAIGSIIGFGHMLQRSLSAALRDDPESSKFDVNELSKFDVDDYVRREVAFRDWNQAK